MRRTYGSHSLSLLIAPQAKAWASINGGEGGIRTHETVAGLTVFKTVPFNHSGTSPHHNCALIFTSKNLWGCYWRIIVPLKWQTIVYHLVWYSYTKNNNINYIFCFLVLIRAFNFIPPIIPNKILAILFEKEKCSVCCITFEIQK